MNAARILRTVRGQRGSMLLLALMVLLGLTSVGLVAAQNTSTELSTAGNVRKGTSAYRVAEGGAFAALARASDLGAAGFLATLATATTNAAGQPVWAPADLAPGASYFDTTATGSFGFEGAAEVGATGAAAAPFTVNVVVTATGMRQPLVGYSLTGPGARCRFKYQFDANGVVGELAAGVTTEQATRAFQAVRTRTFVGPLPCDQAATGLGAI